MRFPQPALRALNVQGQLFVNGGNCVQLTGKSGQEGALGAGIAGERRGMGVWDGEGEGERELQGRTTHT